MNYKRIGLVSLLGVALLALAADPALAAQYDTNTERLISELNNKLLYVAIPITILVEAILFYAAVKFRNNDDPKPTEENRRLEITWTVATALILLFVGVSAYGVMAQVEESSTMTSENADVTVEVEGARWIWTFNYPNQNVTNTGTLVLPANQKIHLRVTSSDWIHAFHAPGLGLKQDAMPGEYNSLVFTTTNTGEYQLYCAEYCGQGHSQMLGTIRIVPQDEYQQWLNQNREGQSSNSTSASNGSSASNSSAAPNSTSA